MGNNDLIQQARECGQIYPQGSRSRIGGAEMIRLIIDIDGSDEQATKEAVAMRLGGLGRVRIVSVSDGKEKDV